MQHIIQVNGVADARLYGSTWEATRPGYLVVTTGMDGSTQHYSFFRFEDFYIPPYATIVSAQFKFYVRDASRDAQWSYVISGVKCTTQWTDTSRNGAARDATATNNVTMGLPGRWYTANIPAIAAAWRDGLMDSTRGICMTRGKDGNSTYKQIYKHSSWLPPSLTIVYDVPASVPTVDKTSVALGELLTTTITPSEDGASHVVNYRIGETVLYSDEVGTGTISTFTPPVADDLEADPPVYCAGNYFPNDISTALTVEVITTVGGESRGAVTTDVTLTLPPDAPPTATATPSRLIVDTVPPIPNFIQNKTGVLFAMDGAPKYGATISSYSLTIEGVTVSGVSIPRIPLTSSGNVGYSFTVTDSRGLSRAYTGGYIQVLPWQPPSFSQFEIKRVNSLGTEVLDGWYAKPVISVSANSLPFEEEEYNELEYYVAYRKIALDGEPEESWSISDTVSISTATYSYGKLIFSGGDILTFGGDPIDTFDDMVGYEFQIFFSDYFATIGDYDEMPTKEIIMDINPDAASVAIGGDSTATPKIGETPAHKKFEVYPEAYFYGGIPQFDYSTERIDTRMKWIDGSTIYRRVLTFGAITNGGSATIPLGEAAISVVVRLWGCTVNAGGSHQPLPYTHNSNVNIQGSLRVDSPDTNPNVVVTLGSSFGSTGGYIVVEYTIKRNLLPMGETNTVDGVTYTVLPYGGIHITGTCTAPTGTASGRGVTLDMTLTGKYRLSIGNVAAIGGDFAIRLNDALIAMITNPPTNVTGGVANAYLDIQMSGLYVYTWSIRVEGGKTYDAVIYPKLEKKET